MINNVLLNLLQWLQILQILRDVCNQRIFQQGIYPKKFKVPVDSSLSRCTKENLSQTYEQVFDSIILNPQGEYLTELFEVEKCVYEQARATQER